jgi:hypothetical protein
MRPLEPLNLKTLTVTKVGEFKGCPPIDGGIAPTTVAAAASATPVPAPQIVGGEPSGAKSPMLAANP